ncbi:hypothetical protein NYG90_05050 [Helicobacter sp. XJK30-2]|uniref:Uncharacterized protein n=1 Tax=Helicobacter zhangjianzhongii TaxID=2974574 RepID=A0ACC6FS01_9HELI|nr:hypothetical protein [Helicobacter sp. XJK30-2]MDL0082044.1 hypothetical protein [Helicobacter sp. XJK30-2]
MLLHRTISLLQALESSFARFYCARLTFTIACVFLGFLCALFMLASLGFLLHIPITPLHLPLAFAISLIPLFLAKSREILLGGGAAVLGGFSLSLTLSALLYDYSWDGRAYHQIGILYLANGWNPVWQKMADIEPLLPYLSHEIWVEHYLKFSEVVASSIVSALAPIAPSSLDTIELGKALNFIAAFGAFLYSLSVLAKFISPLSAAIISLFASFSPVVGAQIATYYVDGLLSCALLVAFCAIIDREFYRRKLVDSSPNEIKAISQALFARSSILAGALLAMASIKLTGVAYAGFIGLGYLVYLLWFYPFKDSKPIIVLGLITGSLIIACNANPLLTNLANGKHFGYPLLGKEKINIIIGQQPKMFDELNSGTKLLYSLFSRTQNCTAQCTPQLKAPFSHLHDEAPNVDTRIAGFGAYFSGVVLLSALMLVLFRQGFRRKEILGLLLLVAGSFLINPESWWARYVPQMYFLPLLVLGVSYYLCKKPLGSLLRIALLVTITINFTTYAKQFYKHGSHYKQATLARLDSAKTYTQEQTLYIYSNGWEHSFLHKLESAKIPFTRLISKDNAPTPLYVVPNSLGEIYWSIESL